MMKMTPQRMAIMGFLEGNRSHPSAEDVFASVSKRFPFMSLATVYNTLERLSKDGKLLELSIDPGRKRYDPDTRPHHHIICTSCGKVADIHHEFDLLVPEGNNSGFSIRSNHVEFYGLCPECKIEEGGA